MKKTVTGKSNTIGKNFVAIPTPRRTALLFHSCFWKNEMEASKANTAHISQFLFSAVMTAGARTSKKTKFLFASLSRIRMQNKKASPFTMTFKYQYFNVKSPPLGIEKVKIQRNSPVSAGYSTGATTPESSGLIYSPNGQGWSP